MASVTRLRAPEEYKSFIAKFDTFMFDCDGVLWHEDHVEPGAIQVLKYLRSLGKSVIFVTNNSTKSRKDFKKTFDKLGIQAELNEIFGSAYASAVYISSVIKVPKDQKVYVIGTSGLEQELAEEGFEYLGGTDPAENFMGMIDVPKLELDHSVSVVLCGFDPYINYNKLSKAFQYLTRNPGCRFICSNEDLAYPAAPGIMLPGAGSMSAPLRNATGMTPVVVGKPNKTMLDCIQAKQHFDPDRTVMVGDRLDIDISFGKQGGLSTLLVLTGCAKEEDLNVSVEPLIVPDFLIRSIGDMSVLAD